MDLDIHLDCSDTIMCTGYLEIHISEEIFKSLDICQYQIIIIRLSGHKTTGNTCNHLFNRNTCSHQ